VGRGEWGGAQKKTAQGVKEAGRTPGQTLEGKKKRGVFGIGVAATKRSAIHQVINKCT